MNAEPSQTPICSYDPQLLAAGNVPFMFNRLLEKHGEWLHTVGLLAGRDNVEESKRRCKERVDQMVDEGKALKRQTKTLVQDHPDKHARATRKALLKERSLSCGAPARQRVRDGYRAEQTAYVGIRGTQESLRKEISSILDELEECFSGGCEETYDGLRDPRRSAWHNLSEETPSFQLVRSILKQALGRRTSAFLPFSTDPFNLPERATAERYEQTVATLNRTLRQQRVRSPGLLVAYTVVSTLQQLQHRYGKARAELEVNKLDHEGLKSSLKRKIERTASTVGRGVSLQLTNALRLTSNASRVDWGSELLSSPLSKELVALVTEYAIPNPSSDLLVASALRFNRFDGVRVEIRTTAFSKYHYAPGGATAGRAAVADLEERLTWLAKRGRLDEKEEVERMTKRLESLKMRVDPATAKASWVPIGSIFVDTSADAYVSFVGDASALSPEQKAVLFDQAPEPDGAGADYVEPYLKYLKRGRASAHVNRLITALPGFTCIMCSSTLTDPVSIRNLVGPECRKNHGFDDNFADGLLKPSVLAALARNTKSIT
jgi:polyhydroxyalkanoate synthesis regulator phasin